MQNRHNPQTDPGEADSHDDRLKKGLSSGNKAVFRVIFEAYYDPLCRFAMYKGVEQDEGEEIVQELFVKLWLRREELHIESSLKAYLFRAVQNKITNLRKHGQIRRIYAAYANIHSEKSIRQDYGAEQEIRRLADKAISQMPPKRKKVYELSRNEGLSYAQIAYKMNISVKTVEAHLSAALEQLRIHLKDYLPLAALAATVAPISIMV